MAEGNDASKVQCRTILPAKFMLERLREAYIFEVDQSGPHANVPNQASFSTFFGARRWRTPFIGTLQAGAAW